MILAIVCTRQADSCDRVHWCRKAHQHQCWASHTLLSVWISACSRPHIEVSHATHPLQLAGLTRHALGALLTTATESLRSNRSYLKAFATLKQLSGQVL